MAEDVHLSSLKSFINECGGVTLAAWKLNVRPSTLKKLLTGQVLSAPTREKLGDIIKKNSNAKPSKASGELKIIRSKLRGMIKNEVDLVEASSRFNVNPSTIRKILRGVPVYHGAQMKIRAARVVPDGEALHRLLVEAGFRAVEIRASAMTIRLPSLETFVLGHLSGMPVAGAVAALSEDQRVALARQVQTALQPYADGDGVAVPDEINIAMAHT